MNVCVRVLGEGVVCGVVVWRIVVWSGEGREGEGNTAWWFGVTCIFWCGVRYRDAVWPWKGSDWERCGVTECYYSTLLCWGWNSGQTDVMKSYHIVKYTSSISLYFTSHYPLIIYDISPPHSPPPRTTSTYSSLLLWHILSQLTLHHTSYHYMKLHDITPHRIVLQ